MSQHAKPSNTLAGRISQLYFYYSLGTKCHLFFASAFVCLYCSMRDLRVSSRNVTSFFLCVLLFIPLLLFKHEDSIWLTANYFSVNACECFVVLFSLYCSWQRGDDGKWQTVASARIKKEAYFVLFFICIEQTETNRVRLVGFQQHKTQLCTHNFKISIDPTRVEFSSIHFASLRTFTLVCSVMFTAKWCH